MAAGRDIARATRLIRKRQAERNAVALAEEEQRRKEAEVLGGMKPSEIRRHAMDLRRKNRRKQDDEPYEDKMDRGLGGEDKGAWEREEGDEKATDLGEGSEDGGGAEGAGRGDLTREEGESRGEEDGGTLAVVLFASPQARELAEGDPRLTVEELSKWSSSSPSGFTKQDITDIRAELDADDAAKKAEEEGE